MNSLMPKETEDNPYKAGMYIFMGLWLMQLLFHYNTGSDFTKVCESLERRFDDPTIEVLLGSSSSSCFSRTRDSD